MSRAGLGVLLVVAVACSSDVSQQNLDACEKYVAAVSAIECGAFDPTTLFGEGFCTPYGESDCEMEPYFACLEGSATCDASGQEILIDATACEAEADCIRT